MIAIAKGIASKSASLQARAACCALVLAFASFSAPSLAATAEERQACTPDVFRLCSSEIPSVEKIVACMKRERPKLSPACAKVFNPDGQGRTATRSVAQDPQHELISDILRNR